jgi:hypothetical protein
MNHTIEDDIRTSRARLAHANKMVHLLTVYNHRLPESVKGPYIKKLELWKAYRDSLLSCINPLKEYLYAEKRRRNLND